MPIPAIKKYVWIISLTLLFYNLDTNTLKITRTYAKIILALLLKQY